MAPRHRGIKASREGEGMNDRRKIVVYIAGAYRASTERGVVENIRRAESVALEVWKAGYTAICPHMNTALFGGACADEAWLAGDIEIMKRCDVVLLVPGWESSKGTVAEYQCAVENKIQVCRSLEQLQQLDLWIARRTPQS
jgi:hypothetical protein